MMSDMDTGEGGSQQKGDADRPFICGVCEGFYGKPWSKCQRKDLYEKMKMMGLTTYLYAPKDDHKHRLHWRELYTKEEAEELRELIKAAHDLGLNFVYAISPGLDIEYSCQKDVQRLYKKLDQVVELGCKSWALLFDDIEEDMAEEDERQFKSLAGAQIALTNKVYERLKDKDIFLFCPTEYCSSRASPSLKDSLYLRQLGKELNPKVDVMWTGQKVVTREILEESISAVNKILKRRVVIWDNIHANDYDQTRLYLGAYEGRAPGLRKVVQGVFTNPNCEYGANFIAMHTLAQWSQNTVSRFRKDLPDNSSSESSDSSDSDMDSDCSSPDGHYQPREALTCAIKDWIPEFYIPRNHDGTTLFPRQHSPAESPSMEKLEVTSTVSGEEDMDTNDKTKRPTRKAKMQDLGRLTKHDLHLLCDLFYLPFKDGHRAQELLGNGHWLLENTHYIRNLDRDCSDTDKSRDSAKQWYDNAIRFHDRYKEVAMLVDKFVNVPNRVLLYELYNYVSDMRGVISMLNSTIKWHGLGEPNNDPPYSTGEQEPWVHHGGLHAKFRRLLPIDQPAERKFLIRPYLESDKDEIYKICHFACGDHNLGKLDQVMGDDLVGGLLQYNPDHCYVLEVNEQVDGFMAYTHNSQDYWKWWKDNWLPKLKEKYSTSDQDKIRRQCKGFWKEESHCPLTADQLGKHPAYLQMMYRGYRIKGWQEIKRLFHVVRQRLVKAGVSGVHSFISNKREHMQTKPLYTELGFRITREDGSLVLLYDFAGEEED